MFRTVLSFFACGVLQASVIVTGGYINITDDSFEIKTDTFDVTGHFQYDYYRLMDQTPTPYANPLGEAAPFYGSGTVNGIYYPDLQFANSATGGGYPLPVFPDATSYIPLAGPVVYGTTSTVTAPFYIDSPNKFSIFVLGANPVCLECNITLQGNGTATFKWQSYQEGGTIYQLPNISYTFASDPASSSSAPEPSTWMLFGSSLGFLFLVRTRALRNGADRRGTTTQSCFVSSASF